MAKMIGILLFAFSLAAEIIHIDTLEEINAYLDNSTWVLIEEDAHFGLTAHSRPINADTLKELAMIGIGYTFRNPFPPDSESKGQIPWQGGVLFISDFNSKAKVFRKWLEMAQFRPSNIVIIDQAEQNLHEMQKEMDELQIPCNCFHYLKPASHP